MNVSEMLSVNEAAQQLGVHHQTIRNWIQAGTLKAYRLGGRFIRISPKDLSALGAPILGEDSKTITDEWQDNDEFSTTYGTMKQAMQESRDDMRGYLINRLEKYFELTRFSVEAENADENPEWDAGFQAALALIKGEPK